MNQKTSKVEKEFYLRCSYLTLSVLFDKEPFDTHLGLHFHFLYSKTELLNMQDVVFFLYIQF